MLSRICSAFAAGVISLALWSTSTLSWVAGGSPICTAPMYQYPPRCVSDGSGGLILSWHDARLGEANADIYAQRINASGVPLWTENGVLICSAGRSQSNPVMVADGAGGAVIAWPDNRNGSDDIYAQRIGADGVPRWMANGVPISTNANRQYDPVIASDGAGGAIIAWVDDRAPTNQPPDVYAQRVDSSGLVLWAADGAPVCIAIGTQSALAIASDGEGGAIIAWDDTRALFWDNNIYAQRMSASGVPQWGTTGRSICSTTWPQRLPVAVSDGAGGAIVAWTDERSGEGLQDVFAQHVTGAGNALWVENGIPICQFGGNQEDVAIAPDGAGGALLTWQDFRIVNPGLYAQRISGNATVAWTIGGAPVCLDQVLGPLPIIVTDGEGGAIVAWLKPGEAGSEILAQRLSVLGNPLWSPHGVSLCASVAPGSPAGFASDAEGGVIVTWQDLRSGAGDIYAQRIRGDGELVATLLSRYEARLSDAGILVSWTLVEPRSGTAFLVERSNEAFDTGSFAPIDADVSGDGSSFAFLDAALSAGGVYRYRVILREASGDLVLFETDPVAAPRAPATLFQNRPNPFNPSTEIRFYLPERGRVSLCVFDVRGDLVRTLEDGVQEHGFHSAIWNGRNGRGEPVASGVYIYRLRSGKETLSRKMVLTR